MVEQSTRRTIDQYTLIRPLGEGTYGMGWLAQNTLQNNL